jgi:DNA repair protein RadC
MFQRAELPVRLAGVEASRAFFAPCFASAADRETLWVAHLDGKSQCIHLAQYGGQSADHVDFPLRAIISDAALRGSAGLVLAHNHPSGDTAPSESDRRVTKRLATAAEAIDVTVLDHLIFARGGDCTSLRRMGVL